MSDGGPEGGLPPACMTVPGFLEALELDDDARELAAAHPRPRGFIDGLVARDALETAVRCLAHSLPPREGVFWAWSCAKRTAGDEPPEAVAELLAAVERWIGEPTDGHRRAAWELGEEAGLDLPAGCAALAAFLGGGSIGPPDAPYVPAEREAVGEAVAGSVLLAAVEGDPRQIRDRLGSFVAHGLEVADRVPVWTDGDGVAG